MEGDGGVKSIHHCVLNVLCEGQERKKVEVEYKRCGISRGEKADSREWSKLASFHYDKPSEERTST